MNVSVVQTSAAEQAAPLLVVLLAETAEAAGLSGAAAMLDERLGGRIAEVLGRGDFRGKAGETLLLYPSGATVAAERLLLVGVGKAEGLTAERLRQAGGTAAKQALRLRLRQLAALLPLEALSVAALGVPDAVRALAEGVVLGAYRFDMLKTAKADEPAVALEECRLLAEADDAAALVEAARLGEVAARAENYARTLGNLPGNVATPSYLAEQAQQLAAERGLRCTVLGPEELRAEGMGALLAVAAGSAQEPRLIVLEHRGGADDARPLVLLGKGLTFDSGGISIKPAASMEEMKFDMSGGAAVLAALGAVAELGLPVNVVGVVPSSENLLAGAAMKPGDILTSLLGTTIEVVNTDAEGRLILADALGYLRRFQPAAVVDAATLTGACVIALGHQASAVMGNDDALVEELRRAGERSGERVWPLPMLEEYREQLKSDYADLKNTGGRAAGAITAGWFLREFVGEFAWAHLDVAGTAHGEGKLPYLTKGSTGVPTRLFIEWVRARAEANA